MNEQARNAAMAQGCMFLSVFGSVWLLWGLAGTFPSHYEFLIVASASASLIVMSWRAMRVNRGGEDVSAEAKAKVWRQFNRINVAQWVAVMFTVGLLLLLKKSELITPAIVVIVGIHFVPLSFLFQIKAYLITGPALIIVACASPLVSGYVQPSSASAIGAGVILLANAAYFLVLVLSAGKQSSGVAHGNG